MPPSSLRHRTGSRRLPRAARALLAAALLTAGPAAAQLQKLPAGAAALRAKDRLPLGLIEVDLAGRSLTGAPGFTHLQSFYEGTPVEVALDPARYPGIEPGSYLLWVVEHRSREAWGAQLDLVDARGAPQLVTLFAGTLAGNATAIDTGTLSGDAGIGFGVGYDVVLDVDGDGRLSGGDAIDGLGPDAGFWVVRDPADFGPLAVTETNYFVTGVKAGFEGENTFYPTNIAAMGELPLVVVSHGNGHNYNWYDHIGLHLASWGFVVMSLENDTGPGIDNASNTTLDHTEAFLASLDTIEGGVLDGHVDGHRIVWIGHSRGAEGIVRAYDKLVDGVVTPQHYGAEDIVGLSSIAPTVFLNAGLSDPHGVPYSLWTGAADNDVDGCANASLTFTFRLFERATGDRYAIYLHGVGHGAFHNGGGSLVANGPCLVGRVETHTVMRTYLLPLVHRFVDGSPAASEFLWRQAEELASPNVTYSSCVVVNKTYEVKSAPRWVIDDFQDDTDLALSSSGGAVTLTVGGATESALSDPNKNFTFSSGQPMNTMTHSANGESRRGLTFGWTTGTRIAEWEIVPGARDFTPWRWFSFRVGQVSRHPNTIAELGDVTFDVVLRDEGGTVARIGVGAYGRGAEEPYQRGGCGTGTGWTTFFETFRLPIEDFLAENGGLDPTRIEAVRFEFGASHGNAVGRLVLDDLELVTR